MGAINYGTSDYITLGVQPVGLYDLLEDPDFLEYLAQEHPEENPEEIAQEHVEMYAEEARATAEDIMGNYSFYYWHVVLKSGYYGGFYLDIESNFSVFFTDYYERKEAMKEIRELEKLMKELAESGLVAVYPGWCTSYADHKTTMKEIRRAAHEMREETKYTPTYGQYIR